MNKLNKELAAGTPALLLPHCCCGALWRPFSHVRPSKHVRKHHAPILYEFRYLVLIINLLCPTHKGSYMPCAKPRWRRIFTRWNGWNRESSSVCLSRRNRDVRNSSQTDEVLCLEIKAVVSVKCPGEVDALPS